MNVLVTGGAGFIGSNVVRALNDRGIVPDVFDFFREAYEQDKWKNLLGLKFNRVDDALWGLNVRWDVVIHMGAVTDTTPDESLSYHMYETNYLHTCRWMECQRTRLIYASSAAVYGNGNGPLNYYGYLKLLADEYLLNMTKKPSQWVGLRFFNVYGPGEQHKGKMASMIYQAYCQIKETGKVKLFKDGTQKRDFVHVDDVVNVIMWMIDHPSVNGIFDVGCGKGISFVNIASLVAYRLCNFGYPALEHDCVELIDMPEDIKNKFQVDTKADVSQLLKVGYPFNQFTMDPSRDELSCLGIGEGIFKYISWLQNR